MEQPNLLTELLELKNTYDINEDRLNTNIFSLLHNEHEEVKLHSRFISYLLSPTSSHRMGDVFLQAFLKVLDIPAERFNTNSSFSVIPNELNKTEYKEIDILIKNAQKQAILIENKINAVDSNHVGKADGYNGQLERYYNTIQTGVDVNANYDPIHHCKDVSIIYLSMYDRKLFDNKLYETTLGNAKNVVAITYGIAIREWLQRCIELIPNDNYSLLYKTKQYLNLINKMTNNQLNPKEKSELKEKVALDLEGAKYLINNFKHVKWHTVHEFWMYLLKQLGVNYNNTELFPEDFDRAVSVTTHENKLVNHGILFSIDGVRYYISCENVLTWGKLDEPKEFQLFQHPSISGLDFVSFQSDATFDLIDPNKMYEVVRITLDEISRKIGE